MSDCKYCGGNCPEQVDKNGEPRHEYVCDGFSIAQIDIEIESCEGAIADAYTVQEVKDLENRIQELSKKRREIEDKPTDELSNIRNWDGYGYYKRSDGN